ncbi:MAG: uroporphyrinogen-III synthase [Actinobacteria bacterium]|nr:uroporphyrinogen-III synthase [Actinomycetota bacterium]
MHSADKPLTGLTIVVTRARHQAAELVTALESAGASVLEFPVIKTVDPPDWAAADTAIGSLAVYDWVVFTSANAVRCFLARMQALGREPQSLRSARIATVGTSTAALLAQHDLTADLVPDDFVAEGLIDAFERAGVGEGCRILLPRALRAREVLPETLRAMGASVDVAPVYRTVVGDGDAQTLARLAEGGVDAVTFTSPSTVSGFLRLAANTEAEDALTRVALASIGPVTSDAIVSAGYTVAAEANPHTVGGLVEAIAEWVSAGRKT